MSGPDGAATISLPSGALTATGLALLATILIALWLLRRMRHAEARASDAAHRATLLQAIVDAAPAGVVAFAPGTTEPLMPGSVDRVLADGATPAAGADGIAAAFTGPSRDAAGSALGALTRAGRPFSLVGTIGEGESVVTLAGQRVFAPGGAPLADLVWAVPAPRPQGGGAAAEGPPSEILQGMLDALTIPVWHRRPDLTVSHVNAAAAVQAPLLGIEEVDGVALAANAQRTSLPQTTSRNVLSSRDRRLFEVCEMPLREGGTVGFAQDVTALETAQSSLSRHLTAQDELLGLLSTAIAVFGADQRLRFFNAAYARLWGLDPAWLEDQPSYSDVLEELRSDRRLPEAADFPAYKRSELARFAGLIETQEELLHLPDGRTLRSTVSPHPLGGLFFTYEDVTDSLSLERSYNTLIQVQRATLNNLYEGVAVLGADGRLQLSNPSFLELWRLGEAVVDRSLHITALLDATRDLLPYGGDWPTYRNRLLATIGSRERRGGQLFRPDGRIIDYAHVPLPDGATLIIFLDVTERQRVEEALRARNEALEQADRLKTEFLANVSYELRTPLNAIVGFAEFLGLGLAGPVTATQVDHCRSIREASESLVTMVDEMLDLSAIEAGHRGLETEPVDLVATARQVISLAATRAGHQGVRLDIDAADGLSPIVADERRIKQSLLALVTGAVAEVSAGGRVLVSARAARAPFAVEMGVAAEGSHAGVVEDDGDGEQDIPIGTSRSRTGLVGLTLVERFIALHGGRVERVATTRGMAIRLLLPERPPAGDGGPSESGGTRGEEADAAP